MHPRQASVLAQATEVAERTAGKKQSEKKEALATTTGPAVLWKYEDPEGGIFFLEQKRMTGIRSPFNGKTFTPKPVKFSPSQVGKEIKEDRQQEKAVNASTEKTASEADRWKA